MCRGPVILISIGSHVQGLGISEPRLCALRALEARAAEVRGRLSWVVIVEEPFYDWGELSCCFL